MYFLSLFLFFFLLPAGPVAAEEESEWDKVRMDGLPAGKYKISSGTGFFVSSQYIITNAHVVQNCQTIAVRGAVSPVRVQLMAMDNALDLALLGSPVAASRVAYLRSNNGVKAGDRVFVMGYPLTRGETGEYLLVDAAVTGLDQAFEAARRIDITQGVEHGNSGGPLIDSGGNVIGVIVAKSTAFLRTINTATGKVEHEEKRINGVAIGLSVLKEFLARYRIYTHGNSTYDMFAEYRPDKRAREYVVNVHCVER